jgi:hypothetical protein
VAAPRVLRIAGWAAVGIVGAVIVAGIVVFMFGEDLFGSDNRSIDDYNEDALRDTSVFPGARLVQIRVYEIDTPNGEKLRVREQLYATSASMADVRRHYELNRVSTLRGVSFDLRPDGFRWTTQSGVTPVAEAAAGENTVFLLRAAQSKRAGIF